ncbi:hypothetical protein Glove_212g120 [Diversispora epigaea]|uniref:Uncharacterized protein n=1 Tax=Diversispora epigaea TaxID=1348612 RepID=A0A397IN92_9GLOM|nr:hypothetical protein Glove_212g120 [Diversispora epigaea]
MYHVFDVEDNDHLARIKKPEDADYDLLTRIKNLEQVLKKESRFKKNHKFQTKCIQIAKEILKEKPIIEYHPSFLNGLELDTFFQKYQIALEVQGAQHRFHNTSWYKDVKKLEDIVNRDLKKRCICQDNGIFLLELNGKITLIYSSADIQFTFHKPDVTVTK